jgi:paraquat-inducible protein B
MATPGIGGNSIGYKELFLDKQEGGKSLNETISDRFNDLNKAMKEAQSNPGDPAKLMVVNLAMNSLQQTMSTTSQLINSMKSMTEGINRNI